MASHPRRNARLKSTAERIKKTIAALDEQEESEERNRKLEIHKTDLENLMRKIRL